ncbi:Protein of unknown function [Gryllus bimaculatus]|nr:Protein of unknown function [Gryllus bimaculatus]
MSHAELPVMNGVYGWVTVLPQGLRDCGGEDAYIHTGGVIFKRKSKTTYTAKGSVVVDKPFGENVTLSLLSSSPLSHTQLRHLPSAGAVHLAVQGCHQSRYLSALHFRDVPEVLLPTWSRSSAVDGHCQENAHPEAHVPGCRIFLERILRVCSLLARILRSSYGAAASRTSEWFYHYGASEHYDRGEYPLKEEVIEIDDMTTPLPVVNGFFKVYGSFLEEGDDGSTTTVGCFNIQAFIIKNL